MSLMMLIFGVSGYQKIGIMSALDIELKYITEHMQIVRVDTVSQRVFTTGMINGIECVAVKAGIGKVNAAITAEILSNKYNVDAIIFSGVAGGINPNLQIGDIIISEKVLHHDFGEVVPNAFIPWDTTGYAADTYLVRLAGDNVNKIHFDTIPKNISLATECYPSVRKGRVVTGDQFIASEEKRHWLEKTLRADCVEMEGAAVAQVCAINSIPFVIIRCLSDLANENASVDFDAFCDYAARNSSALVLEIIKSLRQ